MRRGRRCAALCAVAVGLLLLPATASAVSRASAREQAQNHRISRVIETTRQITLKLGGLTGTLGNVGKAIVGHEQRLQSLETLSGNIDGRLKVIEAAAPQILDGLTQLTTKLTELGSAYKAVEYGRAAISAGDADLTIAAGGANTSADIPDDGNTVNINEGAVVVAGAGATNESLDLRALIRSAESDGDSSSKTAGQAGGFIWVQDLDTGARKACIGAPNPPGIFGTTPGDSIVTPSGTVTNLPVKNIPGGHSRTDTTEPTGANGTSLLPAPCTFAATPGHTYNVHWSVNFLDIPTSTTPGPTE